MDLLEFAGTGVSVTLGVDTHKDAHVAVALDGLGRRLGSLSAPASAMGYTTLMLTGREDTAQWSALVSRVRALSGPDSPAF